MSQKNKEEEELVPNFFLDNVPLMDEPQGSASRGNRNNIYSGSAAYPTMNYKNMNSKSNMSKRVYRNNSVSSSMGGTYQQTTPVFSNLHHPRYQPATKYSTPIKNSQEDGQKMPGSGKSQHSYDGTPKSELKLDMNVGKKLDFGAKHDDSEIDELITPSSTTSHYSRNGVLFAKTPSQDNLSLSFSGRSGAGKHPQHLEHSPSSFSDTNKSLKEQHRISMLGLGIKIPTSPEPASGNEQPLKTPDGIMFENSPIKNPEDFPLVNFSSRRSNTSHRNSPASALKKNIEETAARSPITMDSNSSNEFLNEMQDNTGFDTRKFSFNERIKSISEIELGTRDSDDEYEADDTDIAKSMYKLRGGKLSGFKIPESANNSTSNFEEALRWQGGSASGTPVKNSLDKPLVLQKMDTSLDSIEKSKDIMERGSLRPANEADAELENKIKSLLLMKKPSAVVVDKVEKVVEKKEKVDIIQNSKADLLNEKFPDLSMTTSFASPPLSPTKHFANSATATPVHLNVNEPIKKQENVSLNTQMSHSLYASMGSASTLVNWDTSKPENWTMDRVVFWLNVNKFGSIWVDIFQRHNVCGEKFFELTNLDRFSKFSTYLKLNNEYLESEHKKSDEDPEKKASNGKNGADNGSRSSSSSRTSHRNSNNALSDSTLVSGKEPVSSTERFCFLLKKTIDEGMGCPSTASKSIMNEKLEPEPKVASGSSANNSSSAINTNSGASGTGGTGGTSSNSGTSQNSGNTAATSVGVAVASHSRSNSDDISTIYSRGKSSTFPSMLDDYRSGSNQTKTNNKRLSYIRKNPFLGQSGFFASKRNKVEENYEDEESPTTEFERKGVFKKIKPKKDRKIAASPESPTSRTSFDMGKRHVEHMQLTEKQVPKPLPNKASRYILATRDNKYYAPVSEANLTTAIKFKECLASSLGFSAMDLGQLSFHMTDYESECGEALDDTTIENIVRLSFFSTELKFLVKFVPSIDLSHTDSRSTKSSNETTHSWEMGDNKFYYPQTPASLINDRVKKEPEDYLSYKPVKSAIGVVGGSSNVKLGDKRGDDSGTAKGVAGIGAAVANKNLDFGATKNTSSGAGSGVGAGTDEVAGTNAGTGASTNVGASGITSGARTLGVPAANNSSDSFVVVPRQKIGIDFDDRRASPYVKQPTDFTPQRPAPPVPPGGRQSQKSEGSDQLRRSSTITSKSRHSTRKSRDAQRDSFQENVVSFKDAPALDEESDDDSEDNFWVMPPSSKVIEEDDETLEEPEEAKEVATLKQSEKLGVSDKSVDSASGSTVSNLGDKSDATAVEGSTNETLDRLVRPFDQNNQKWIVRPSPNIVYENLEKYFPNANLDQPIYEVDTPSSTGINPAMLPTPTSGSPAGAGSGKVGTPNSKGGNSGVAVRASAPDDVLHFDREQNFTRNSRRNTIRGIVKKRISEVPEAARRNTLLRRSSTKLWGRKVVEITSTEMRPEYVTSELRNNKGEIRQFAWIKGELIGKGTYGKVFLALNVTTGEMMAVKQVDTPRSDRNNKEMLDIIDALHSEMETMKDLDHPHIVQYLGFEKVGKTYSLFLDYVAGGSIGSCLRVHGRFDESLIRFLIRQCTDGLAYLHSCGILHRDLKADNLLLDLDGVLKITDFGISKRSENIYTNDTGMSMQGTINWMAPEVIDNVVQDKKQGYSAKIDIWSLGCVVLEMYAGERPWGNVEVLSAIYRIGKAKLAPPIPEKIKPYVSSTGKYFLDQCFQIDPSKRPTARELYELSDFCKANPDFDFNSTRLAKFIRDNDKPRFKNI